MFEMLTKIIELIMQGTDKYSERKTEAIKRQFGNALITCYLWLLDIISHGWNIADTIQSAVMLYDTDRPVTEIEANYKNQLNVQLKIQAESLTNLMFALYEIEKVLAVYAPDVAKHLSVLSVGKRLRIKNLGLIINPLIDKLEAGGLPVALDTSDWSYTQTLALEADPSGGSAQNTWLHTLAENAVAKRTRSEDEASFISARAEWTATTMQSLKLYLDTDHPQERLHKLEEQAQEMRKFLLENFELEDVLWSVNQTPSKRRVSSSYHVTHQKTL
ncbi:MAG: hypothetical protein M3441_01115 [Chloroflexota bacterium]|nr:hypothetical protein [Chloroflexota bacterium]